MAMKESYQHGEFNWVDLCTSDTDAAKSFYSELFGVAFQDDLDDDGNVAYTVGFKNELPVSGMMVKTPDMAEAGIPDCWETYICVDDVESAATKVSTSGGRLLGPVADAPGDAGRLAVVADPTGAIVILWQPLKHHGSCLVKEHGTTSWNELVTDDVDAAMGFYSVLLGWSGEPMGDNGLVGIRHADNGDIIGSVTLAPEGVPSHWSVYFAVDDCDAAVQHALRLGGRVVVPAVDMTSGRAAQLADKDGAMFWVIDCDS